MVDTKWIHDKSTTTTHTHHDAMEATLGVDQLLCMIARNTIARYRGTPEKLVGRLSLYRSVMPYQTHLTSHSTKTKNKTTANKFETKIIVVLYAQVAIGWRRVCSGAPFAHFILHSTVILSSLLSLTTH